ncbi:MAG: isoprenylcysteine carboxylmethyltransferase family protein [Candidatus Zixiibacteriota bacterium]
MLERKAHHDRDDLAGEHEFGDAGQVLLLVVFLVVWIGDSFIRHYTDFLARWVPVYGRITAGALILILSGYIAKSGLSIVFDDTRVHTGVIREGIFGRVRHPVYLGSLLFYLGLTVITFSIASAVVLLLAIVFYSYIASYEERLLIEKFGDEYRKYRGEVPRWFPLWKK